MEKVPQGMDKFQKFLYHRNQREKIPVGSGIHPNWSHISIGKCMLKFSYLKNQEPYHLVELRILILKLVYITNYKKTFYGS